MESKATSKGFQLEVPLDASGIEDVKPDHPLKVVVQDRSGALRSEIVQLDRAGKARASFQFEENPGKLRVVVGPENASDEELLAMQTIHVDIPARRFANQPQYTLNPIVIRPYFWYWWLRWCRTFTIRGRVVCADGKPVPGASVCAYDVDMFWWWCSKELVGCDTTDVNGEFEITFNWCCGWWPWYWWYRRLWYLEPHLVERILPVLQRELDLPGPIIPRPKPDVALFERLIASPESAMRTLPATAAASRAHAHAHVLESVSSVSKAATQMALDPTILDGLRERVAQRLPVIPELAPLHLWPWHPWHPWWDCTPDIIFRVTQDCHDENNVIVNEHCFQARWNIPTTLNETLVANDLACCLADHDGCEEGNCLALTHACDLVETIGGNPSAPAAPATLDGYYNPAGLVTPFDYADRPYAGAIPISGTVDCIDDVDYYSFEWSDDGGMNWNDVTTPAAGAFQRVYIDFSTTPDSFHHPLFAPTLMDGKHVYRTVQRYEADNPGPWGGDWVWLADNYDMLMNWLTDGNFADGTYWLRVKGYDLVGGQLANERVLLSCGEDGEAVSVVVTIDNRVVGPTSGHPASTSSHPVTPIHWQTLEPDTDVLAVRVNGQLVDPCDIISKGAGGTLEIDFLAHDVDGHLASYDLQATYGENGVVALMGLPSATLTTIAAAQVGPTYTQAVAQGATRPVLHGGTFRLTVTNLNDAFPVPCAYQLELIAYKRTIVNCSHALHHYNRSEYSFTVIA